MFDLQIALRENVESLKKIINKRYAISVRRAKAEYAYRSALGQAMATEKMNGMAATALYDYCRGYEHIAKLRQERDLAIAEEKWADEMVAYFKTEIRIASSQIEAERRGL